VPTIHTAVRRAKVKSTHDVLEAARRFIHLHRLNDYMIKNSGMTPFLGEATQRLYDLDRAVSLYDELNAELSLFSSSATLSYDGKTASEQRTTGKG
jgi:hypothetical protein